MDTRLESLPTHATAVVWLDGTHALVARGRDGRSVVTEVDRNLESETRYLLRIVREAEDCDRVVIMGPDASRIAFEREFVALYRRPDRLIDVGLSIAPDRRELLNHLRVLEPSLPAPR